MELIPHVGAGELRFGMDEAAVRAILGEPTQRIDLAGRRTAHAFRQEVDVVFHAEQGLVGITLATAPAQLFGAELFALDRGGIEALLRPHAATTWDPLDASTRTLSTSSLGLIVYFDTDEPTPCEVELASGTWHHGVRVD
jgi:hypothetical protein